MIFDEKALITQQKYLDIIHFKIVNTHQLRNDMTLVLVQTDIYANVTMIDTSTNKTVWCIMFQAAASAYYAVRARAYFDELAI